MGFLAQWYSISAMLEVFRDYILTIADNRCISSFYFDSSFSLIFICIYELKLTSSKYERVKMYFVYFNAK